MAVAFGDFVQFVLRRVVVFPREIGVGPCLEDIDEQKDKERTEVDEEVFLPMMLDDLRILFRYVLFYVLFSATCSIFTN